MQEKCGGQDDVVHAGSCIRTAESGQVIVGGRQYSSRHGSVGRSRMEERREEMKVMFGKRLEVLEEGGLVKVVVNKLRKDGDSAGGKSMR